MIDLGKCPVPTDHASALAALEWLETNVGVHPDTSGVNIIDWHDPIDPGRRTFTDAEAERYDALWSAVFDHWDNAAGDPYAACNAVVDRLLEG